MYLNIDKILFLEIGFIDRYVFYMGIKTCIKIFIVVVKFGNYLIV